MKRYGIGLQFQGMSMMITPYESIDGSWVKWEDIHELLHEYNIKHEETKIDKIKYTVKHLNSH